MTKPRNVSELRDQFPAIADVAYLDVAGRAPVCAPVRAAIEAYLDERARGGDKERMFGYVERARAGYARLIGASLEEIAMTKNISEGLNAVATAFNWRAGDNVVLCPELEHANNVYLWYHLQRRFGIEVRRVDPVDGAYPVDRMIEAMDARTRVVSVSSVSFSPGFRTPLDVLGPACRDRGAFLLVDGAQSAGVLATDVDASNIDGLAVSTQKGLLGLYGFGFLYVRRAWADQLDPSYLARFGVALDSNEAAQGGPDYRLKAGALRFDLGNYNFLGAVAAARALALLDEFGVRAIEDRAVGLAQQLADGLENLGWPVWRAPLGQESHIITVGRPGSGHGSADDPALQRLYERLVESGVRLSVRKGMLRFSCHAYNALDDIERVLNVAKRN